MPSIVDQQFENLALFQTALPYAQIESRSSIHEECYQPHQVNTPTGPCPEIPRDDHHQCRLPIELMMTALPECLFESRGAFQKEFEEAFQRLQDKTDTAGPCPKVTHDDQHQSCLPSSANLAIVESLPNDQFESRGAIQKDEAHQNNITGPYPEILYDDQFQCCLRIKLIKATMNSLPERQVACRAAFQKDLDEALQMLQDKHPGACCSEISSDDQYSVSLPEDEFESRCRIQEGSENTPQCCLPIKAIMNSAGNWLRKKRDITDRNANSESATPIGKRS